MNGLAIVASAVLASYIAFFVVGAWVFARRMGRPAPPANPDYLPLVAVILPVRGDGSTLRACLDGLLLQDYPRYRIHLVIHSVRDGAWNVANEALRGADDAHSVEVLSEDWSTCSAKCAALAQATEALSPDVDVVVLTDADVTVPRRWLHDLVAPLADSSVGATFGIPWHTPRETNWGSLVRWGWWSVAGPVMALHGWVWGGAVALRASTLREAGMVDIWRRSMSSDTPMSGAVTATGRHMVWVPTASVAIQGECTAAAFLLDVTRYLFVRRLYLPLWRPSRSVGDLLTLDLLATLALAIIGALSETRLVPLICLAGLVAYFVCFGLVLVALDNRMRRIFGEAGVPVPWRSAAAIMKMILAAPWVHLFFIVGTIRAETTGTTTWHGTTYAVDGPWSIRVKEIDTSFPQ